MDKPDLHNRKKFQHLLIFGIGCFASANWLEGTKTFKAKKANESRDNFSLFDKIGQLKYNTR